MRRQRTTRTVTATAHDTAAVMPSPTVTAPKRRPGRPRKHAQATAATTPAAPEDAAPASTEPAEVVVSAKTQQLAAAVTGAFRSFVSESTTFFQTRAEVATPFMRAFLSFKKDTKAPARPNGLGMADFVRRFFDPSVPADRDAYKKHKAFNAANNLARLYRDLHKPKKKAAGPPPETPLRAMARLVAAILPLLPADQVERLWSTIERELHWQGRRLNGLKADVLEGNVTALMNMRPPRGAGGTVPQLRISPSRGALSAAESELPAPARRTGTHG
jgi:hypothetical protein